MIQPSVGANVNNMDKVKLPHCSKTELWMIVIITTNILCQLFVRLR